MSFSTSPKNFNSVIDFYHAASKIVDDTAIFTLSSVYFGIAIYEISPLGSPTCVLHISADDYLPKAITLNNLMDAESLYFINEEDIVALRLELVKKNDEFEEVLVDQPLAYVR